MAVDWFDCRRIVSEQLFRLDWRLADGSELAREIWEQSNAATGAPTKGDIEILLFGRYAEIVHAACGENSSRRERAFAEMRSWLFVHARSIVPYDGLREDIVQQVMLEVMDRLPQRPLDAPRSLWAYLLSITKNKLIDTRREENTQKRGSGRVSSLEAIATQQGSEAGWEEQLNPLAYTQLTPEEEITRRDTQQFIHQILKNRLASPLQVAVILGTLEGLKPRDLAEILDKKPHEIRMAKARALKTLRSLPAESLQALVNLLGG